MQAVSLPLPTGLVDRVGACADQVQRETRLLGVNRTDALRNLIQMGLAELDKQNKRPPRRRG